jgi:RNA polymerase sigma-70 factor (ECF subfamily)
VISARAKTGLTDRQLYELVHVRVRALAGPSAADLDDLIQVAAEQTFRSLERFDGSCELTTWVYAVCYRVLLMQRRWYRRWKLRFSPLSANDDAFDDAPLPPELLEARARSRSLHRALARMTDKYRAIVVLHDLEELKVSEIALIVDAGELTVRSRLRDGRKQLAKLMHAEAAQQPLGAHELNAS